MAVYRFRVAFEDYDDVVRDIEIKSTQTFEDLHNAIQQYIGFDGSKPSSFYLSDDNWKKGKEITNRPLNDTDKEKATEMSAARLLNYIADPHQKIYYIFDLPLHWTFRIELVKIQVNVDTTADYPRCVRSLGDAPKQYGNVITGPLPDPDDFEDILLEEETSDEVADEIFTGTADAVEADEVPLAVESEEGVVSDFEDESGGVAEEDDRKEGEDF
jgi:hypothetical protein